MPHLNSPLLEIDGNKAAHSASGRRLAYLLSIYPAVSHTFFLNEICELRKLGFDIEVASINAPDCSREGITGLEAKERKNTFYIKTTSAIDVLSLLIKILFTRPLILLRGLRTVLSLDLWSFRAGSYALFYLIEALLVGNWMRQRGIDHLHVHFGGPVATVAMLVGAAWGTPYSIMIHGPDEFYEVDRTYLCDKIERAKFVFCISDYCRSQVMKISSPSHWGKLHVLRLGVDPEIFTPGPARKDDSSIEIVCVGRLVRTKGHLILLEAVSELLQRGYPVRLRLIGEGADRSCLEEFVSEHGLGESIVFEGARNHEATRQILRHADIFALASFAEGLPIALMEAMAMQIPCVSTYVAAIPELIRDGVDGLLVPPSSREALLSALERLIIDPELRGALARSGRIRVLESYNLKRNMRALGATFDSLLIGRAAREGDHPIYDDRNCPRAGAALARAVRG